MLLSSSAYQDVKMNEVLGELANRSSFLVREYLRSTRETLELMLAKPELLNGIPLKSEPGTYSRNLLLGEGDMSVWAMTWASGAKTSIHDHHCSCCFGVLQGSLTEIRYHSLEGNKVVERERVARNAGFIDCLLPSGPNIHMMANESSEDVISIHIYGYDHMLHKTSVRQEYEVVAG
ncbi:cysteine dioxygenase [Rhizobium skierniewicense]|nr:cysteine dioxygenase [Rhizobium skierniewicense]